MVSSRTPDANVSMSTADGRAANGAGIDGRAASSRDDEGRGTTGDDREWSQSGPASLSMPTDLRNLVISHLSDSGRYSSTSPDHHHHLQETTGTTTDVTIKIGCHDVEESYEGFGSVEGDSVDDGPDSPGGSSSAPSPTGTNSHRNPRSPNSTVGRHSWLRTSLRRTPPCSSRKRLSSNALASQLYRSGSFNSSGMGSNYDATDDVYSDVSLEDVMDLNHKTVRSTETEMKQDAAQNCPAEFHRYTENRGESTSLTDTAIRRAFVNPVYEDDDDSRCDGSENEESNQDTIFMRPGSIHRILTKD